MHGGLLKKLGVRLAKMSDTCFGFDLDQDRKTAEVLILCIKQVNVIYIDLDIHVYDRLVLK